MKIILKNILIICVIIIIAALGFKFLTKSRPKPASKPISGKIPLVKTRKIILHKEQIVFTAFGTVEARERGSLVAEVSGKVIYISPKLTPGATVNKGEVLLKLDPRPYQLKLLQAMASVQQAQSQLTLIQSKSQQAIWAWQLEHGPNTPPPPLVAKKPELKQAKANLEQAKANLEQAKLNLSYTVLKAPFKAKIIQTNVVLGQYVPLGQSLALFYNQEKKEVKVPLEPEKIKWLKPKKTKVAIADSYTNQVISGTVVRFGATVDPKTRLLDVYVKPKNSTTLLPGAFVKTTFFAKTVDKVCWIPPSALHDFNTVWLAQNGTLQIKQVSVLLRKDKILVYGLKSNDKLIVTPLGEVKSGIPIKEIRETPPISQ
ncbi:MAG: efflux RND transporter periplasmic adaptor subunit [Desulfonauticus sp.]|nr:efflux RND transporter periplasmic adaptor subunit [Desulfonauticus sp.]